MSSFHTREDEGEDGIYNHIKCIIRESMIPGVPQILDPKHVIRKLVRFIIFSVCLFGFIYQVLGFMQLYWKYAVQLNVQVTSSIEKVDFPSITICNINGIQPRRSCKKIIEKDFWDYLHCGTSVIEMEALYARSPRFKKDKWAFHVPRPHNIHGWGFKPQAKAAETFHLQQLSELINTCTEFGFTSDEQNGTHCDLNNTVSIRSKSPNHVANVCYTLNTLVNQNKTEPRKVYPTGYIDTTLFLNFDEYAPWFLSATAHLAFHSPYTILSPYDKGFEIVPGRYYVFKLRKIVGKALPFPYSTDCVDYRGLWKSRGNVGPTNKEECIQECWKNVSRSLFGCIPITVYLPHNELYCAAAQFLSEEFLETVETCKKQCRVACFEEYYEVDVESEDVNYLSGCKVNENLKAGVDYVYFRTQLDGFTTTTYSYVPQFRPIDVFHHVGSYAALWIGVSVLPLYDLVENIVWFILYRTWRLLKYLLCNRTNSSMYNDAD